MSDRVLSLLSMCMEAKESGHHVFFYYSPHINCGEVTIDVHINGWKAGEYPAKRFIITINGTVGYKENSFDEVENYMKGLIA